MASSATLASNGPANARGLTSAVTGKFTVPVVSTTGASVGSVEIDAAEFGGKINKQLLHDVVLMYRANQRAGTHSTLRRGEVAGSTKKLFRQKGTGNARAGTKRTNKRRGRRHGQGAEAPRLQLQPAQEGRPGGHPHGPAEQVPRRRGSRCSAARARGPR